MNLSGGGPGAGKLPVLIEKGGEEDAGISRGSFYTYFDSKWDVLGYLCESFINEFYECGVRCLEEAQGDIWEMLGQFLNGSLALCRDERRADFIRNIMDCSSREALTFDIFSSDPDSPRAVRGRKLERAAYESCVGKSLRKLGWEEYMSFFRMAMMAIAMEIKSFHDGVPENRIRERFALTLGILKRGAGIESGAGAQSAERK